MNPAAFLLSYDFSIENLDSSVGYLRIVFVVGNHYDGGAVLKNATEAINEGGKNILFYNNALGQIRMQVPKRSAIKE